MAKKSEETPKKEKKRKELRIESLALTYRPKTIEDLVGQDHIAAELKGMLKRGRFPNTILLNGESGCGKTTTGRMIARYLMCKKPDKETYAPCGECQSCLYEDGHPDVHELNMAESRGIDDVRSLIQSSKSMPTVADNRIFIIDECLPADSEIEVSPGVYRTLLDIVESAEPVTVLSYNHYLNVIEEKPVEKGWLVGERDDLIDIEFEGDAHQVATSNSKWWSVTRKMYVRADELLDGEEVLSHG